MRPLRFSLSHFLTSSLRRRRWSGAAGVTLRLGGRLLRFTRNDFVRLLRHLRFLAMTSSDCFGCFRQPRNDDARGLPKGGAAAKELGRKPLNETGRSVKRIQCEDERFDTARKRVRAAAKRRRPSALRLAPMPAQILHPLLLTTHESPVTFFPSWPWCPSW